MANSDQDLAKAIDVAATALMNALTDASQAGLTVEAQVVELPDSSSHKSIFSMRVDVRRVVTTPLLKFP